MHALYFFFCLLFFILYFYTPLHTMSGAFISPFHFQFHSPPPFMCFPQCDYDPLFLFQISR